MVSFDGDPIFKEQNLDQFLLALVALKLKLDFSLPDLLTSLELSYLLYELWLPHRVIWFLYQMEIFCAENQCQH